MATFNKAYKSKAESQRDKRAYLDSLIQWAAFDDSMRRAIAPILFSLINETGKLATQEVGGEPSQFNPTTPDILNYNQARALRIATDVNDETEKQLRASLGEGFDQDEAPDELTARIEAVMGNALTYRSDRIAGTEVTRAQGFADVAAWSQTGTVTGKEWYAVQDERTCPFCSEADGMIVSLQSDFYSLGDVLSAGGRTLSVNYDTIGEPPLHANCRCRLLAVTVPLDAAAGLE